MPMSAASRRARCRPTPPISSRRACYLDNFKLVDRGRFREKELHAALTGAKYPARNPVQNVNDLKAQIAANEKGVQELRKMVAHFSLPVVQNLFRVANEKTTFAEAFELADQVLYSGVPASPT